MAWEYATFMRPMLQQRSMNHHQPFSNLGKIAKLCFLNGCRTQGKGERRCVRFYKNSAIQSKIFIANTHTTKMQIFFLCLLLLLMLIGLYTFDIVLVSNWGGYTCVPRMNILIINIIVAIFLLLLSMPGCPNIVQHVGFKQHGICVRRKNLVELGRRWNF